MLLSAQASEATRVASNATSLEWTEIVVAAMAFIGALAAVALTSWFTVRNQSQALTAQQHSELHRDIAAALAQTSRILTDADPDRVAFNASNPESWQLLAELEKDWKPARLALLAATMRHPEAHVRDKARPLEVETSNLLTRDRWLLSEVLAGKDKTAAMNKTQEHAKKARELVEEIAVAIRS